MRNNALIKGISYSMPFCLQNILICVAIRENTTHITDSYNNKLTSKGCEIPRPKTIT